MIGKVFFILFTFTFVSQICTSPITKEYPADQSLQLKFRDIIGQIERIDFPAALIDSIIPNFEELYNKLASLLQSQETPTVPALLDVFNSGIGARLLVVNEDNVQVNADAIERLFSEKFRFLAKSLFAEDPYLQLMLYGALQIQWQQTTRAVLPDLYKMEVPLEKLAAAMPSEYRIATRATNSTDIFTQLTSILQSVLCNNIVSPAYSAINTTLTTATTFLDSLTISSSDNIFISLVGNVVSLGVDFGLQAIEYVRQFAESVGSSICSDLLSSRKRRDVSFVEDVADRLKRDTTSLARIGTQAVGVRSFNAVFALIMSLIAAVVTYVVIFFLTGGVSTIISWIFSSISSSITSFASSLISSVFSFAFGWLSWF